SFRSSGGIRPNIDLYGFVDETRINIAPMCIFLMYKKIFQFGVCQPARFKQGIVRVLAIDRSYNRIFGDFNGEGTTTQLFGMQITRYQTDIDHIGKYISNPFTGTTRGDIKPDIRMYLFKIFTP